MADPLPPSLSTLVDLDEMTRMWGVEKYIGHWDGFAGEGISGEEEFNLRRPNNYYLYSYASGRFWMRGRPPAPFPLTGGEFRGLGDLLPLWGTNSTSPT